MIEFIVYIEQVFRNFKLRCKGRFLKIYLVLHGCKVGKGLKCVGFPKMWIIPKRNIVIGNNVTLGKNVIFEIGHEGKLILGNNILLAHNILFSTITEIRLEDWSGIAENVSVRGSFHQLKRGGPYQLQESVSAPIILEEDTGIGAGCVVLMGVTIPKGVFIGSNSTVVKNVELIPYGIYGGNPAKLLKMRT